MPRAAHQPAPTAVSILAVLTSIEAHPADAPAAIAFRSALARKGREIAAEGGPAALADVIARVRAADPARADARDASLRTAWTGILAT